jgi:NO-binding membrane sensor protein with MHYT domain
MLHYTDIIHECQCDLGLQVSSFHDIGMSALAFYSSRAWQIAQNNKGNRVIIIIRAIVTTISTTIIIKYQMKSI